MELILVTGILYVLQVSGIDDRGDYKSVLGALKSSGFDPKHIDTLWNIVGAVLHLVSGFVRSLDSLTLFSSRTLFPSRKFFYMEDIVSIKDVFFPIKDIVSIKDTFYIKDVSIKDIVASRTLFPSRSFSPIKDIVSIKDIFPHQGHCFHKGHFPLSRTLHQGHCFHQGHFLHQGHCFHQGHQ